MDAQNEKINRSLLDVCMMCSCALPTATEARALQKPLTARLHRRRKITKAISPENSQLEVFHHGVTPI
jgi:hypothetical protein